MSPNDKIAARTYNSASLSFVLCNPEICSDLVVLENRIFPVKKKKSAECSQVLAQYKNSNKEVEVIQILLYHLSWSPYWIENQGT